MTRSLAELEYMTTCNSALDMALLCVEIAESEVKIARLEDSPLDTEAVLVKLWLSINENRMTL